MKPRGEASGRALRQCPGKGDLDRGQDGGAYHPAKAATLNSDTGRATFASITVS